MSPTVSSRASRRKTRLAWALHNPWVLPLGIFVASRLVETALLLSMLWMQEPHTSLIGGLTNWDGQWYQEIAKHGYPRELPTVRGTVDQNAWAFYPLFPLLARFLMFTGMSFSYAGVLVSLICGAGASCLLFRIVSARASQFTAAMAVLGITFAPSSLLFEATYTESLALLIILAALAFLGARRYGWFSVCVLLLAFTRAIVLPFALVVLVHGWVRWRSDEPFPRRERFKALAAAAWAVVSFGLWPLITGIRTGVTDAYLLTQSAWVAVSPWGGSSWLVQALELRVLPVVICTVVIIVVAFRVAFRRHSEVWDLEMRAWTVAYPLYILAAVRPNTSIVRFMLLAVTPWWPMPEFSERAATHRDRVRMASAVAVVGLALQAVWILFYFVEWSGKQGAP